MAVDEHVICKAHLACMRCFRLFALIVASALGLYHASLAGPPSEEGFGGYVQLRLSDFEGGGSYISLRRSKIWFRRTGRKSGYYFQMLFKSGNRSKTDERIYLQVARFWFKTRTGVLMLGQFKPPFSIERFTWDGALKTINRACATKSLIPYGKMGPALVRDYGIQWEGWGRDKRLRYAIACFVGNGANRKFRGNGPLLCLRLRWTPISKKRPLKRIKFLRLETAFAWRRNRDQNFASALPGTRALGYNHFSGYDMRWTVGFGVDPGRASFRGEYYWAYFSSNKPNVPSVHADGYYLQAAYRLSRHLEAALKYEAFDPNHDVLDRNDIRWTTIGINWYIHGNITKLQFNYVFKHERSNPINNDTILIQFQQVF